MAAVKVKGKYWAEWQCTEGHQHRKLALPNTKKAARTLAGSLQEQVRAARYHGKPCCPHLDKHEQMQTVAHVLEAFLEATHSTRRSHGHDRARTTRIKAAFGTCTHDTLTVKAVEDWKLALAQEFSPANANRYLHLLRAAINWGRKHGYWQGDNPISRLGVTLYKEQPYERSRCLTPEEEQRLLDALPTFLHPLIIVAVHTGARKGNLFSLKWTQVDLQGGTFTIPLEKSGKKRVVVLNSAAKEALLTIKRESKVVSQYVFCTPQGKCLKNNFDRRYWRPTLKRAGIPDFRFHDLRHTFTSRLVAKGVHSLMVQQAGGWADGRMLQRYVHHEPNQMRAALESLAQPAQPTQAPQSHIRPA
jgi:integrase